MNKQHYYRIPGRTGFGTFFATVKWQGLRFLECSRFFGPFVAALVAFLSANHASAQGVLTNGWTHAGEISAGETDMWSIAASPGESITVQVAKLSGGAGFTPRIEILAPNGATLGSKSGATAARLDIQAGAGGEYAVAVSDANGTGTGTYGLQLVQIPTAFTLPPGGEGGPLTNGAIHSATINVGESDIWTLTALQGDRIAIQVAEVSGGAGFTPMIELFSPDGRRVGLNSGGVAARLDIQAGATGTYTVLVSDSVQGGPGGYQLQLAQIPGTFIVSDEGGALADAADSEGTILLGDLDLWSFTASPGDLVTLQVTETSGGANFAPMIEMFAPTGEHKNVAQNASVAGMDAAVELGGIYTVAVSDANQIGSGGYRLRLTRGSIAPAGANVLTNGGTLLGSISSAGETNTWTFTATAGESLVIRAGETAATPFVPWVRLYGPDGAQLDADFNAAAAEVTVRATNSGTFSVTVNDGSNGRNQTGNYRISLAKTGSPLMISPSDEGGALTNGTTYLATIDVGDIDAWSFTANAGETVVVRIGEATASSPLLPWLRLYGPNGVPLDADFNAAAAEVTARATNSGTFLVVVADGNNGIGGSGNYRISLAKTGSAETISSSDEGGALTNGTSYQAAIDTGDVDAWTFTANAGESIVVRAG
jgi:hypothetical protein